jgi:hypothetical protein
MPGRQWGSGRSSFVSPFQSRVPIYLLDALAATWYVHFVVTVTLVHTIYPGSSLGLRPSNAEAGP